MKSIELWEFCREYPLEEKIFIVPTRSIGLQMINKINRDGYSTLNLKPITLKRLAFEICQDYIEENEKLIIDDILGTSLILQVLKDLTARDVDDFFFTRELIDIRTAEEIYKVLMELKYSGLREFPKEKSLDRIYEGYEEKLRELNAMDYHDIIQKARSLEALEVYKKKKIGLAYNIEFENVEQDLLRELTKEGYFRIKMPVKSMEGKPKNYYFREEQADRHEEKTVNFYKAYGSKMEIQYIIDDMLGGNIPADEVVIAYTNGKYADLINIEFEKNKIPISFGQGLEIQSSSIFRFLSTISKWSQNYFGVKDIEPIFFNGDIGIDLSQDQGASSISAASMYEELVLCKIFHSESNYSKILGFEDENWYENNKRRLGGLSLSRRLWLREFFKDLFAAIPKEDSLVLGDYVPRLVGLINKYSRNLNKYDGAARNVVLETLNLIEDIPMSLSKEEYFPVILSYLKKEKILRAQAQAGHVFATSFKNAAYTGRKNLYLIGLDSDSISNKVMESPILLDNMRRELSDKLSFARESYRYKKYKIKELITGNFTNISVGYSSFDTVDVKNKAPSQIYNELMDLYKQGNKGQTTGTWTILGKDLVHSGTALETLGDCSRKAYLKYKLKLEGLEELDLRVDRWLDGLSRGNLVHKILSEFFDLASDKQTEANLKDMVYRECQSLSSEIPYVIKEVYLREREEIYGICKDIVDLERADKQWDILVNELVFGDSLNRENRVFGKLENLSIDIGGFSINISGAIDRVDINSSDPSLFRIVDYKTGNRSSFEKKLRVKKGSGKDAEFDYSKTSKFQHYIYEKALRKILDSRRDLFPSGDVSKFTYIFQGRDKKALVDIDFNEEFERQIQARILELLEIDILEADKSIIYDPGSYSICRYCEYKPICRVDKDLAYVEEVDEYEA